VVVKSAKNDDGMRSPKKTPCQTLELGKKKEQSDQTEKTITKTKDVWGGEKEMMENPRKKKGGTGWVGITETDDLT